MKKIITIVAVAFSAILILDSFNVWHAAAMFYFAGEIPGTQTSINPTTMMSIFALLIGFVMARLGNRLVLVITDYQALKRTHQQF